MIENLINKLITNNVMHRLVGIRKELEESKINDLELMSDYALNNPFHFSAFKMIYDNRVEMYERQYYNVQGFKGLL